MGDAYWSEDLPGVVLRQDTVRSITGTVDGPRVRSKAPPVQEVLMDGTTKDKASYPLLRRMQARAKG